MKTKVDADLCIGCGLCAQMCPEVFTMEGDKAVVSRNPVSETENSACSEAVAGCPVNAISLE